MAENLFPVVGIGASAGGLDALKKFFTNMPPNQGLAFVVVQHMDPEQKGFLAELLQTCTKMKVAQVTERTVLQQNSVYIIPPDKELTIEKSVLNLIKPTTTQTLRLPINFFFRALAEDQQEQSIGVILSGMGSDGTAGLQSIKEKGGLVIVQDPEEAKFNSMPLSAIDAGLADIVAPISEIPSKIIGWFERKLKPVGSKEDILGTDLELLEQVIAKLRTHTGQDFTHYKRTTIYRRVVRRMGIHQFRKMQEYAQLLEKNPMELDLLLKELLIGVTSFFRDPSCWDEFREQAILPMLVNRPADRAIRAWVPACSTGEEAYSMAIILAEAAALIEPPVNFHIQVFATDLDRDAIDKARVGIFPESIAENVSEERLQRFFTKKGNCYRIRNEIREMVIFAPHNLIMDPPFTTVDILSCRNLLIYFDAEIQRKLLPLFHYSLNPDGILLLGNAETIGSFTHLFSPIIGGKSRLFRRLPSDHKFRMLEFPSVFNAPNTDIFERNKQADTDSSLQSLANRFILNKFAPPTVLVNSKGDILYTSGRTGNFLEPAAGKANWNIFAMAREDLRNDLSYAFQKALRTHDLVRAQRIILKQGDEAYQLEISLKQLEHNEALQDLVIIAFQETYLPKEVTHMFTSNQNATGLPTEMRQIEELIRELNDAREQERITRSNIQTAQEELRSTNEEMQSTSEEMQSTNEELMTSKEEMQSLNEELETVNNELQSKIEELSRTNNDMKNLLESTGIATIFLDTQLKVRGFTEPATQLIRLIPGDVGRPVTDLASELINAKLANDASEVIKNERPLEKSIQTREDKWYLLRIMPYNTVGNRVDGVVITFVDITKSKKLELELRREQMDLKAKLAEKEKDQA